MIEKTPEEELGDIDDDDAFSEGDHAQLMEADLERLPELQEEMDKVVTKDDAKMLYGRLAHG